MRILYGAGYVDRYAKLVMAGAVFSPVLAVLLSILLPSEPAIIGEYGPNFAGAAAAYAITIFIFQLVLLPRVAARCLRMRIRDTFKPMVAPLAIVLVASPILLVARYVLEWTSFLGSVVSCGLYGCAVCVLFGLFGLSREERHRFTGAMLRRMSRSRGEITQ